VIKITALKGQLIGVTPDWVGATDFQIRNLHQW
jgi:hypothetical protein